MINLPYRNLLPVSLLFYSCAGTQPGWTYQLEDDPQYIQGVGQVTRSEKNFREKAFKAAEKNQILIDVIYNPLETSFLKLGNKIGAKTLNGLDMFIYQGLASLDLWFGESLSKQVNFTQIKSYLETKLC